MKTNNISKYLEQIKLSGKFDLDYIDCLFKSLDNKYDGAYIAKNVIEVIEKRYDKNKKNNS